MNKEEIILKKLNQLKKSKFRSSFHLRKYMIDYIDKKGIQVIKKHTRDFIEQRLSMKYPYHDGTQTPTKGHPTFVAMHATATCCRNCLFRIHHIEKGKELTNSQKNYIELLILMWIKNEYKELKNENK